MSIPAPDHAMETATGPMLLAVEAVPESQAVIAQAASLARRSRSDVLVLSVRERDYVRGFAWDVHQPGEIATTISDALYELQRVGVPARGVIRTARSGRVADEIVYAAHKYHVSQIVMGGSRRSWLGRLFFGSVSPRVLRLADLPVVIVRGPDRNDSRGRAPSGSPRGARGHARA
jgi:nucleotide-binding universal stress UspA family protein